MRALSSSALLGKTNEYFGGVEAGALFTAQARKVVAAQYKGPQDGQLQENVFGPALLSVERDRKPDEAWKYAVVEAQKLTR